MLHCLQGCSLSPNIPRIYKFSHGLLMPQPTSCIYNIGPKRVCSSTPFGELAKNLTQNRPLPDLVLVFAAEVWPAQSGAPDGADIGVPPVHQRRRPRSARAFPQ